MPLPEIPNSIIPVMKKTKQPKTTYKTSKFDELHFAVSRYGSSLHRELFDMMVDAGMTKKQIFLKFVKMIRQTSETNHKVLKHIGIRHWTFDMDTD